jgi:hypothetical protein
MSVHSGEQNISVTAPVTAASPSGSTGVSGKPPSGPGSKVNVAGGQVSDTGGADDDAMVASGDVVAGAVVDGGDGVVAVGADSGGLAPHAASSSNSGATKRGDMPVIDPPSTGPLPSVLGVQRAGGRTLTVASRGPPSRGLVRSLRWHLM